MIRAAIAIHSAAPTISGICRSITARCSGMAPGMMVRSITGRLSAVANSGFTATGAMTNGAARIRAGGAKAVVPPPLGVDYYRSNGFHGRWDRGGNDRRDHGRDNGRGFDQRDNGRGFNQEDGGRGFDQRGSDREDGGRGFNQRDSDQAARGGALDQRAGPQPQAAPQQPQRQYSNPPPPGFQPRNGAYGHYTRPNPAAAPAPAPAAAPAPAPAAAPAAPATGDRRHDH